MAEFLSTPSSHKQNLYLAKKIVKMTSPALRDGVKKTLPRIWGHQNQLNDQDKEPMIDTRLS